MFDRFHANVKILRGLRFNFPRAEPNANFNAKVYLPDKSIVSFHASGLGLFARPEQRCCRYFATIMNVSFRFYPCPVRVNFSRDKKDAANTYIYRSRGQELMDRATTIGSRPPVNFHFSRSFERSVRKGNGIERQQFSLFFSRTRELLYTESTRIELLSTRNAIPLTLRSSELLESDFSRTPSSRSRLNKRGYA